MKAEKNKGGRPKKQNAYVETIGFKVTRQERLMIEAISTELNCSLSQVIRKAINVACLYQDNHNNVDLSTLEFESNEGANCFVYFTDNWYIDVV
jgi:hypothetical protein